MLTSRSQRFMWLITFIRIWNFISKTITISSLPIKFIPRRKIILLRFLFIMRIHLFLRITCLICSITIKWLIKWWIYFIFIIYWLSSNIFPWIFILIFRLPIKWNISVLILNTRNMLFPHLRLKTRIRLLIIWTNIPIRLWSPIF